MSCPTLDQLPQPSPGKTGWPWTEESPQLPDTMPDGHPWPRVSIVTPSYNQGQFIEETIRSVLLQGYPNLEYIIIDGGSADDSVEIIRKYEPWLAYWGSERDAGQTDAINKGLQRATGEIFAWLNSDDFYTPGAVGIAASNASKDKKVGLIHGSGYYVDSDGRITGDVPTRNANLRSMLLDIPLIQPSVFFSRAAIDAVGDLDGSLYYVMDLDFTLRVAAAFPLRYVPCALSCIRIWSGQKTQEQRPERFYHEEVRIRQKLVAGFPTNPTVKRYGGISIAAQLFHGALACATLNHHSDAREFIRKLAAYDFLIPKVPISSFWLGVRDVGLLAKSQTLARVERYLDILQGLLNEEGCPQASRLVDRLRLRLRPFKAIQSLCPDDIAVARRSLPSLLLHDITWWLNPRLVRRTIPVLLMNRSRDKRI